jgi:hypothetical protein
VKATIEQPKTGGRIMKSTTQQTSKTAWTWSEAVLQPRLALAVALTLFFLATVGHFAKTRFQVNATGFNLRAVNVSTRKHVLQAKRQAIRYYEEIQIVYRIAHQLRSLENLQYQFEILDESELPGFDDWTQESGNDEESPKPNVLMATASLPAPSIGLNEEFTPLGSLADQTRSE